MSLLAMLGGPTLILVGWVRSARSSDASTRKRRTVVEWIVVGIGVWAATPFLIVLIAWATA